MKNQSKGSAWVLPVAVVAIIAIVGVGAWLVVKKPATVSSPNTNTEQTDQSDSNQTGQSNNETRLEFPWSKYDPTVTVRASSNNGQLIGETVNMGGFSKATLVIGMTLNAAGATNVGSAYVFDTLNLAANGKIDKLYVESATSLQIATGAIVGQKIVLSHNDLVRQAEAAAGINSQPAATNNSTKPTPPPGAPPPPAPTPTVAVFAGQWNGTYTSSPLAGAACNASGAVSLSMNSSGGVTGYAVIHGIQTPGTGKVTSSGNLSGSWNYTGTNLTYSGQLNSATNSGSGTYKDALGCFGSFTVRR